MKTTSSVSNRIESPQSRADYAFWGLLIAVISLLPFLPAKRHSIVIILTFGAWCFQPALKKRLKELVRHPLVLAPLLFYLFMVMSLIYSENLNKGLLILEQTSSLFIFPLIVGAQTAKAKAYWAPKILLALLISVVLADAWLLYRVFTRFSEIDLTLPSPLQDITPIHPSYLGVLNVFAAAVLFFVPPRRGGISLPLKFRVLIGIGFSLLVVVSTAKMAIGILLFILLVGGVQILRSYSMTHWQKLVILAMPILLIVSIIIIPTTRHRFENIYQAGWVLPEKGERESGLTIRLIKWDCAREIIGIAPWMGHGIGSEQGLLNECYREREFWGHSVNYNAHNQYLQTGIALGFVGMGWLLCMVYGPLFQSKNKRHPVLTYYVVILGLALITESMLNRQLGVQYFAFLFSLFTGWIPAGIQGGETPIPKH